MDSLTTISMASAVIAEEWRQTNRNRPREGYHLVVVRQRDLPNSRTRRAKDGSSSGAADMEQAPAQAPAQAIDRSELRTFLVEEEARHQRSLVRPLPVSRNTSTPLGDLVMELSGLRHDMVSYEALYPAAVEVRNNLGDEIWDGLEDYRCRVAYLAFATVRLEDMDTIDFPNGFRDFLDQHIPHMETYIRARWGEDDRGLFQCAHENMLHDIEEFNTLWFRRQPVFWLAYNLFFSVEKRLSWEEVSTWAIQWLRRIYMEPPAWPIQLRGLDAWNPDTTPIWNRAVLELLADVRRRFGSHHTLQG